MRGTTAGSRWRCGSAARYTASGADGGADPEAGGLRGLPLADIAVTARSMEVYGPVMESVFQRDGIPAYISRRSDILAKPPLTMLLGAVDAVTGGFRQGGYVPLSQDGDGGHHGGGMRPAGELCDPVEHPGNMWLRGHGVDGKPRRLRAGDDGATAAAGWRSTA